MPLTASISIVVPALSDTDVWFANAAAWSNYWNDISGTVTLDPITTTTYGASAFVDAGDYVLYADDVEYRLVQSATLQSLKTRVDVLNDAFETMRTQLRNAGLITNAQ